MRLHGWVGGESVELAGTIGDFLVASVVCAEAEEAVLAPLGPPGVANNPILFAPVAHLFVCLGLAIADHHNTVVDLEFGVATLKEVLGHHSGLVELEVAVSVDTNTNWLLVEKSFKLIVTKVLFLDHADILEGNTSLIVKAVVTVGLALVWVVIVVHYTILRCVLVRFVHPAAIAAVVVGVTI
jgi:hypothetical protein